MDHHVFQHLILSSVFAGFINMLGGLVMLVSEFGVSEFDVYNTAWSLCF